VREITTDFAQLEHAPAMGAVSIAAAGEGGMGAFKPTAARRGKRGTARTRRCPLLQGLEAIGRPRCMNAEDFRKRNERRAHDDMTLVRTDPACGQTPKAPGSSP